ncbi:hypothetical protein PRV_01165 [Mycoplasma parvum str. Indiana]|uniref:Uncharacterized protein n=1 Tax=Mycoplasma parvum str. Indiana TaxID=1403316 RepID=U5NCE9_9MOLU|nr:hypothetical protein PRV_01165 [Mycoplasma parvum str. Indiana]
MTLFCPIKEVFSFVVYVIPVPAAPAANEIRIYKLFSVCNDWFLPKY